MTDPPQMQVIAVDTETDGKWQAFCATVAWRSSEGIVSRFYETPADNVQLEAMLDSSPKWVFHNAKFDLGRLADLGVIQIDDPFFYHRFEDTETMAHLLDEHRKKGLKYLARELLGLETDEEQVLKEVRRKLKLKKSDGFEKIPLDILKPYALKDAEFTLALYEHFQGPMQQHKDLASLYLLEKRLTLALLEMEQHGLGVDTKYLQQATAEYRQKSFELEMKIRDLTQDENINPNSPIQMLAKFKERGLDLTSTSTDALKAYTTDPLVQTLLELRKTNKILSTYFEGVERERIGGILKPNFRQHGTRTGRMSSGSLES